MLKENYLLLIFVIFVFYLIFMPLLNNYYVKNNNETFEKFDTLLIDNKYMQKNTPLNINNNPNIQSNFAQPTNLPQPTNLLQLNNNNILQSNNMPFKNETLPSHESLPPTNNLIIPQKNSGDINYEFNSGIDPNNNYLEIGNLALPDDMKIDKQMCSLKCCGLNQWTPLMDPNFGSISQGLNYDYGVWATNQSHDFVGSNFSCNNGNNGNGCVCLNKNIMNVLSNHAGNL
jgi:hypothetical protein